MVAIQLMVGKSTCGIGIDLWFWGLGRYEADGPMMSITQWWLGPLVLSLSMMKITANPELEIR